MASDLGAGDDDAQQANLARQGSSVAVEQGSGPNPQAPPEGQEDQQ